MEIYFQRPAEIWEETFPIGNGSLGAMIFGSPLSDMIGLNDDQLWSGYPKNKKNPEFSGALMLVRKLILEGKRLEAEKIIEEKMEGEYTESYLPLGNLSFSFIEEKNKINHYERRLNLDSSIVNINYDIKDAKFSKEYFASFPDQAIYGRFLIENKKSDVQVDFTSELSHNVVPTNEFRGFRISGQCPEHVDPSYVNDSKTPVIQGTKGLKFQHDFRILKTDGIISTENKKFIIKNASFVEWAFSRKSSTVEKDYEIAKKRHIEDYKKLYGKVDLYLGAQKDLPTDKRVLDLKDGKKDPGLIALYFQFGRYLLISSSRVDSFPANLQGIWNWHFRAPWSSNYTTNINAEMNYWPADVCNLSECFLPYEKFIKKVIHHGEETAQSDYKMLGSVVHHNTDRWFLTNPVGKSFSGKKGTENSVMWAYWPMGGVWYANDLYRHYEYQPSHAYLAEIVYPILRKATTFLCEFVVKVDRTYHTIPSTSPENSFIDEFGNKVSVDKSSTMDIFLIQENFDYFIETCQTLEIEDQLLPKVMEIKENLAKVKIGSQGQILEYQEEFEELELGHRHFSPLYGLFPGELIKTDKFKNAALETIKRRMNHGGGGTGWSNAWLINLYSVLGKSEEAYQRIVLAITDSSYPNLWGKHPPFQIDSNFGVTAGIASLFVQDRNGKVTLLPSLPKELSEGWVKGLRIKDNKEVSLSWKNGKIVNHEIKDLL